MWLDLQTFPEAVIVLHCYEMWSMSLLFVLFGFLCVTLPEKNTNIVEINSNSM